MRDAKRIGREGFGHHQALAYGDWTRELEMFGRVMEIEVRRLVQGTGPIYESGP